MARTSQPLTYSVSPYVLALSDLLLWVRVTFVWPPWDGIPSIILPILPFRSGALDELYPTPANLFSLLTQLILTTFQALFLLAIPVSAVLGIGFPLVPPPFGAYVPVWIGWIVAFVIINQALSNLLLNGYSKEFTSHVSLSESETQAHQNEKWVFVNGVAAGSHWMQSNLDRLSLAFRREIYGIHNPTRGIIFDLIECVLERTFSYPASSTRMVFRRLLDIVSNEKYEKIVVILHSQGAIEGGLALDYLFATVPAAQLSRMEVYTFGSAANHFDNPVATTMDNGNRIDLPDNGSETIQQGRTLKHIEHYANSNDYVSKLGILNFRPLPPSMMPHYPSQWLRQWRRRGMYTYDPQTNEEIENRYVGRLFIRKASGHQLNGNYLDDYFTMNRDLTRVLDGNDFMNGDIDPKLLAQNDIVVVENDRVMIGSDGVLSTVNSGRKVDEDEKERKKIEIDANNIHKSVRVKDVSRLWMYRNGMSPPE